MNRRQPARRPRIVNRPKVKALFRVTEREKIKLEKELAVVQRMFDRTLAKRDSLKAKIAAKELTLQKLDAMWNLSEDFTGHRRSATEEED